MQYGATVKIKECNFASL